MGGVSPRGVFGLKSNTQNTLSLVMQSNWNWAMALDNDNSNNKHKLCFLIVQIMHSVFGCTNFSYSIPLIKRSYLDVALTPLARCSTATRTAVVSGRTAHCLCTCVIGPNGVEGLCGSCRPNQVAHFAHNYTHIRKVFGHRTKESTLAFGADHARSQKVTPAHIRNVPVKAFACRQRRCAHPHVSFCGSFVNRKSDDECRRRRRRLVSVSGE